MVKTEGPSHWRAKNRHKMRSEQHVPSSRRAVQHELPGKGPTGRRVSRTAARVPAEPLVICTMSLPMTLSSPRMRLALLALDVSCATKPSAAAAYQGQFNIMSGGKGDVPLPSPCTNGLPKSIKPP